jgi:hypothetical protein
VTGLDEPAADARAPVLGQDRQPVHVAPPTVPGGDQHADDPTVQLGDEQRVVAVLDQAGKDALVVGRGGGGAAGALPQVEDRLEVTRPGGANGGSAHSPSLSVK